MFSNTNDLRFKDLKKSKGFEGGPKLKTQANFKMRRSKYKYKRKPTTADIKFFYILKINFYGFLYRRGVLSFSHILCFYYDCRQISRVRANTLSEAHKNEY